jgi:gamma-glutamyltranspeptidase/glutathione hydrolase
LTSPRRRNIRLTGILESAMIRLFLVLLAAFVSFPQEVARPDPPRPRTMRPVVRGLQYAVSSLKPEATQVAERILRAGGNAFDAAVAGQAVLGLVDISNNGIGGDAMLLVFDAKSGKAYSVNAGGAAPKLATIEWYKTHQGGKLPDSEGLLAGTVPGVIDAWYILLERWGTMSFEQVLAPAIEMAESGFPIGDRLAGAIRGSKKLRKYPTSAALYYPGGEPPASGQIYKLEDLAHTMKRLVEAERQHASKGRREALRAARNRFYKGDIAREMAEFSEENGGLFRYEDFAAYTAKVEEPVSIDYRGYQVLKNPSANQGPAELFTLNLLEGFELGAMGHNSAEYIHTSAEAVKLAFADRDKYVGDADFLPIPYAGLLSKEYARERRRLIDAARASLEFRPGEAEKYAPGFERIDRPTDYTLPPQAPSGDGDTSYIAVVDKHRNVVSFTPSLHNGFGTNVVMGRLGFSFNCRGDYFSLVEGHANALAPGKRPRTTLQSTLVLKDGRPAFVLGSPGGDDQCLRTMQTFLNIVEFGMNIQQAIEAPRWSTRSFPMSYFPHTMYPGELTVEDRIPTPIREALEKKGHNLKVNGPWSLGMNAGIAVDLAAGVLSAGADPRTDAYALAW